MTPSATKPISGGFASHLKEAIQVNSERQNRYSVLSGGKSVWLSRILILCERIALFFVAWYIDRCAAKFHSQGIPIIAHDFVPMTGLSSTEAFPIYNGVASDELMNTMSKTISAYRKQVQKKCAAGEFMDAAKESYELLQHIRAIEEKNHCHFAMTRHVIESIGFGALNAQHYAEVSKGETVALSKTFLWVQTLSLYFCLTLDGMAQPIHKLGVGILVNDLPIIPFEENYQLATP